MIDLKYLLRVEENKKMSDEDRNKIKEKMCRNCAYRGSIVSSSNPKETSNITCDYIGKTGKSRGLICAPGECKEAGIYKRRRKRGEKRIKGTGAIKYDFTGEVLGDGQRRSDGEV